MTAQQSIEGHVDRFEGGRLKGWAWRPSDPAEPLIIEAVLDGQVIGVTAAALHREDLGGAGKRDGRCAFEIELGDAVVVGDVLQVRVRGAGDVVPGSPFRVELAAEPVIPKTLPVAAPLLPAFLRGPDLVGALEAIGPETIGGWAYTVSGDRLARLELIADGRALGVVTAERWRTDLEEARQGDGRVGYRFELPRHLRDGASHRFEVRDAVDGSTVLALPIDMEIPAGPAPSAPAPAARPKPHRRLGRPHLSVVIVFYNMRREAERALTALSRSFQQGIEDIDYEVLVIDNGSAEPLTAQWVESFGSEFRLSPPSRVLPSPCFAINEAARRARGKRIAVMIDGAHIVSPGAIREAMRALDEQPNAVVSLRQWFIGGDQRWLSAAGWSREKEDILFAKIGWPNNGYGLFQIGSPMYESPNHWFDGLSESNCLFLSMDLWRSIGGMDEAFDEPGAGYANLDLFRRAVDRSSEIISLVGEASFHQYHSGTTTNVDDDRKDALVRGFLNNYRALRGGDFKNVEPNEIYVRGRIRTDQALTARQHLLFPGGVGVTHAIRPGDGAQLFDGASQNYLRSAYIECGLHKETQWLGKPVDLAPADLTSLQEIIRRVRPERIVVADSTEGLIGFVADQVRLLDLDETRIAHVWRSAADAGAVTAIMGVPEDPAVIDAVRAFVGGAERVLVLFEPSEADELPIDTLAAYAELVSWGSYLVFLRSGIGQPYLGYSRNWRLAAIHRLVARGAFSIDPSFEGQLLTLCPRGFLRRTAGLVKAAPYDAQLDKLDQF